MNITTRLACTGDREAVKLFYETASSETVYRRFHRKVRTPWKYVDLTGTNLATVFAEADGTIIGIGELDL